MFSLLCPFSNQNTYLCINVSHLVSERGCNAYTMKDECNLPSIVESWCGQGNSKLFYHQIWLVSVLCISLAAEGKEETAERPLVFISFLRDFSDHFSELILVSVLYTDWPWVLCPLFSSLLHISLPLFSFLIFLYDCLCKVVTHLITWPQIYTSKMLLK